MSPAPSINPVSASLEAGGSMHALHEENRLLFDQLQVVQAELEQRHRTRQSSVLSQVPGSSLPATVINIVPADESLIEIHAENLRLQFLTRVQREVLALQQEHALAPQLGEILIESANHPLRMLGVPARLIRAWRQNKQSVAPKSLGGKSFSLAIEAYETGGVAAVEKLLERSAVSAAVEASAWTAIARTQIHVEPEVVATLARRAYKLEPRGFRMKWLAFRLHESGELLEAEALLALLPNDIQFSDSEARQADRLKCEALGYRRDRAQDAGKTQEKRELLARQWQQLIEAHANELAAERSDKSATVSKLREQSGAATAQLEQARQTLAHQREQIELLLAERTTNAADLQLLQRRVETLDLQISSERVAQQDELQAASIEHHAAQGELKAQMQSMQLVLDSLAQERDELRVETLAAAQAREQQNTLLTRAQEELLQLTREQVAHEKLKAQSETRQRELEQQLAELSSREAEQLKALSTQLQTLTKQAASRSDTVTELFKKQSEELTRVRRHIENTVKAQSINSARQVQSFIGLRSFFDSGVLPAFNSEGHGWPVSSDFALYLVQRLALQPYDLIIEFGSGMSTLMIAKTLRSLAARADATLPRVVSFDHLDYYYQQTQMYLRQAEVSDLVRLELAPLKDWVGSDGVSYPYYDCQGVLADVAQEQATEGLRILVIVDGPPAATGKHARYPAGPLVLQHFPGARIEMLLDDYIREDEKETAQRWESELQAAGLPHLKTEYNFEKDACLITIYPKEESATL